MQPVIVGATLKNKKELKITCQNLATCQNFEYLVVKSDKSRMRINYLSKGCSWGLYATRIVDEKEDPFFRVKTMTNKQPCFMCCILVIVKHRQPFSRLKFKPNCVINNIAPKIFRTTFVVSLAFMSATARPILQEQRHWKQ